MLIRHYIPTMSLKFFIFHLQEETQEILDISDLGLIEKRDDSALTKFPVLENVWRFPILTFPPLHIILKRANAD